jgi:hypothetical protein
VIGSVATLFSGSMSMILILSAKVFAFRFACSSMIGVSPNLQLGIYSCGIWLLPLRPAWRGLELDKPYRLI